MCERECLRMHALVFQRVCVCQCVYECGYGGVSVSVCVSECA